jgi:predicted ATPase/transcriptional regulator with XRE-family HTH domain
MGECYGPMEDEGRLTVSSDFGTLLRRHRLAAGFSQDALAERARMSTNGIGALERGYRRTPQHQTLAQLANALSLSDGDRTEFESAARTFRRLGVRNPFTIGPGLKSAAREARLSNNLPIQLTPLVGRDEALAEVEALVLAHSLVSLVGTGGVGKTRLALQIGENLLGATEDGVWFVELAQLNDPALVVNVIASTFGLNGQVDCSMLDVLVRYFTPRRLTLIVDNCEHVIDEVARVVYAILAAAARVRVVATTREPLRVAGERVYRVPSLAVPSNDPVTAEAALGYGALALFDERARASNARFKLTDENASAVAEVCRRLDGIPLAIELAAARVTVLSPRQLVQKLNERFQVLAGANRIALPRHQTIWASIDWSHNLLSEAEQLLFRRAAIFVGGWTLEAAESVCTGETLDAADVFDLVSSLVEKSLVVAETPEFPRYRFLESTRGFALEQVAQSNEHDALTRRHAEWAAVLGDRAFEIGCTGSMSAFFAEFAPEGENARLAIEWSLAHDEVALCARILSGFSRIYQRLAGYAELGSLLNGILTRLDATGAQTALVARLCCALSTAAVGERSIAPAQRAVDLGERCNETAITIRGLSVLSFGLAQTGRTREAQAHIDRSLRLLGESALGDSGLQAHVLRIQGIVAFYGGRFDDARQSFARALSLATKLGDDIRACSIRMDMAELEFHIGDAARALELVSAVEFEEHDSLTDSVVTRALVNAAAYRIVLGDIAAARLAAREALCLARGAHQDRATSAIAHLATIAALNAGSRRGAVLRGYVDSWYRSQNHVRHPAEQRTYQILVAALHEQLSDDEVEALSAAGAEFSEDAAVAEALAI